MNQLMPGVSNYKALEPPKAFGLESTLSNRLKWR